MKFQTIISAGCASALFVFGAIPAVAVESQAVADRAAQDRYVRLHATASAFSETLTKIADRYGQIQDARAVLARDYITQSEQSAQHKDFAQASQQANIAYELLRASITDAVARKSVENGTRN